MNTAKHIKSIDFRKLWGEIDLHWDLCPDVNILSGSNGSGKSTLLRCLGDMFRKGSISSSRKGLIEGIDIEFSSWEEITSDKPFDPKEYNVTVISTFDTAPADEEALRKVTAGNVYTDLDLEIYKLNNSFLKYQLEIGREVIAALSEGKPAGEIARLTAHKTMYCDIIDSLFAPTGKKIDRQEDSLSLILGKKTLTPYQLSSGEKQILIILTSVLIQNRRPYIMLLDEPEISLHFDWQRRLIEDIMALNPALQLILATHSPAVIMGGWLDRVSEISELVINADD